ncbi:MAG: hypothetical protein HC831_01485 [Chloroflexia bacterium]|nr:hypothetical protein [Chloroflexia bacterium]
MWSFLISHQAFLTRTGWYAKKAFGGPKQVIRYLSRYTHRTAISNDRVLEVNKDNVSFAWNDYKKGYAKQITTIPGEKFLHLFCQHILPQGLPG